MKYGKFLVEQMQHPRMHAHASAYVQYKAIKKALGNERLMSPEAFAQILRQEIQHLNAHSAAVMYSLDAELAASAAIIPYDDCARLASLVGSTLAFIEANSVGLRKLGKKYDKKRRDMSHMSLSSTPPVEKREHLVLRWLELAPFCTACKPRLAVLRQQLLERCSADKRHLAAHVMDRSAHVAESPMVSPRKRRRSAALRTDLRASRGASTIAPAAVAETDHLRMSAFAREDAIVPAPAAEPEHLFFPMDS